MVAPNLQKLIIPGKNDKKVGYPTDMRTIEQWANEGIVRKLIAGSGITLDPSSGVDAGTGIEIASSGGSSSTDTGFFITAMGMDANDWDSSGIYLGPAETQTNGQAFWPILDNTSASSPRHYDLFGSWMMEGNAGDSVCFLPILTSPDFTGHATLGYNIQIQAMDATLANLAIYNATGTIAPSTTVQPASSTYSGFVLAGSDLVLTAGTGDSGNGLVTSGGGIVYWSSAQVEIIVSAGTTIVPTP
jgi:hypothetical protein